MNGLFGLQSMLHKESTAEDFIQVQLEQLENMDIRDNCLATLEGMRLSEETSVSQYKAALNANKNGGNYTFQPPTKAGDTNITKSDGSHVSSNAKPDEVEQLYTNKDKQASEAFDEIMGLDGLMEAAAADAEDGVEEPAPDDTEADEELDQAAKEALEDIPEGSIEEAVDFWNATEQDGTFESNTALEAELVGVDMLIPKDEYEI